MGGGGSSRTDLSSSSCLRNRLFSQLRAFNWREKERDICTEEDEGNNNNISDKTASHATMKQTGESESLGQSCKEVSTSHSFSEINQIKKSNHLKLPINIRHQKSTSYQVDEVADTPLWA